jgi:tetratricopeptide (TPR) repeat protein
LLGQDENQFQNLRQASQLLHQSDAADINPHYALYARTSSDANVANSVGDFAAGIPLAKAGAALPDDFSVLARGTFVSSGLIQMARRHDFGAYRAWLRDLGYSATPSLSRLWYDLERQDWRDMLKMEQQQRQSLAGADTLTQRLRQNSFDANRPFFAFAHAQLGDFARAETLLAVVPASDANAARARAVIADLKGDHARADWWFALSEKQTPSLPLTDLWWGQALLARGQPDAAIQKFTRANTLGPKFADPLEGWGEALMTKNQSHRALEKFAEAEKYAPNWGRLHLKWGEALTYADRKDEAAKQFARAAALDLTPSEKSELAKVFDVR